MENLKQDKNIFEKNFTRDDLTGLVNNYYLAERIEEELKNAKRRQQAFSLTIIDIDNFTKLNQIYGKQTSDIILLETAKKIINGCSSSDIISRYSNEEFAVLSSSFSKEDLIAFAEKIRSSILKNEIITPDGKISVSVSIGIAYFDTASLDAVNDKNHVVDHASSALKMAKEPGNDGIKIFPQVTDAHEKEY